MRKVTYSDFTIGLLRDFGYQILDSNVNNSNIMQECFRSLKLVSDVEVLVGYREIYGWQRGGAETFIASAELILRNETDVRNTLISRKFIAKAPVVFGSSLDRVIEIWIQRRNRLNEFGVKVPRLLALHNGIIFEEFIPQALQDVLGHNEQRDYLMQELANVTVALDLAGFQPLNILPNMRYDGEYIYWVDFGSDLGGVYPDGPHSNKQLMEKEMRFKGTELFHFAEMYEMMFAQRHR